MSRAQGILAGDLAGNAGWCYGFPGDEPQYGSARFAPAGCSLGLYLKEFADWWGGIVALNQPRVIVYEAPILTGASTSIDTALKLMGLAGRAEEIAERRGIPIKKYDSSSVCKWFTGRGRYEDREAKKAAVIRACMAQKWTPDDDDQADAIALWANACFDFAPKVPARRVDGPLFQGERA